jgi:hypothetical protein
MDWSATNKQALIIKCVMPLSFISTMVCSILLHFNVNEAQDGLLHTLTYMQHTHVKFYYDLCQLYLTRSCSAIISRVLARIYIPNFVKTYYIILYSDKTQTYQLIYNLLRWPSCSSAVAAAPVAPTGPAPPTEVAFIWMCSRIWEFYCTLTLYFKSCCKKTSLPTATIQSSKKTRSCGVVATK